MAPMSYRLETTRRFEKDFKKLASDLKRRIDQQVRTLEALPYSGKRLRGQREDNRIYAAPWRGTLPMTVRITWLSNTYMGHRALRLRG